MGKCVVVLNLFLINSREQLHKKLHTLEKILQAVLKTDSQWRFCSPITSASALLKVICKGRSVFHIFFY